MLLHVKPSPKSNRANWFMKPFTFNWLKKLYNGAWLFHLILLFAVCCTVRSYSIRMVANFKVFKKVAPNGKVTVYLGKRDFVDHVTAIEPIDGVVLLDDSYVGDRKVFGQVVCSFRYGREEDEVMGLNFQKDLYLCSAQLYPPPEKREENLTKLQERLLKKLGPNAFPFLFQMPQNAPASVTIQPGPNDQGEPCGVQYFLKVFIGESETDRSHRRPNCGLEVGKAGFSGSQYARILVMLSSTVSLGIRKIQYAPSKSGRQPCTIVRKDFMLSPGELELEVVLDKQVYHHGERIATNICIRNNSNKVVKKIKAMVQQGVDVCLFQNGQYRSTISAIETDEGCPIQPGSSMQKVIYLVPEFANNRERRGIALDGQIKTAEPCLASSTLYACPDQKDIFGIVVSYAVKVKLYLGALSGELTAELPVIIMHPRPSKPKLIQADSQAEVETFRQDTLDIDAM